MAAQYPGAVPTIAVNKNDATVTSSDHPAHHNKLGEEIVAIATELGTDPAGVETNVKAHIVRVIEERLNVEDARFGASVGNTATQNRVAIQAAIDYIETSPAKTRRMFFPRIYPIDSTPLEIQGEGMILEGSGRGTVYEPTAGGGVSSATGDLFKLGAAATNVTSLWFRDMTFLSLAGGGHIFVPQSTTVDKGLALGGMDNCRFEQDNTAKSIWYQTAGLLLDWIVRDCDQSHAAGATVHAWNLESTSGQINEFRVAGGRCTFSGSKQFFHIGCTGGAGWQLQPTFRDINFEVTEGGNIKMSGCWKPIIENCVTWDLVTSVGDLYWLGSTIGNSNTRYPVLRNIDRYASTLGGGLKDVKCYDVQGGVFDAVGGFSSNAIIDLTGVATYDPISVYNLTPGTVVQNYASRIGSRTPSFATTAASAGTLGIPEGAETVTVSGTTTITSITAEPAGRQVKLLFGGVLTMKKGSNLALDSDYVTAAGDSISLTSDGTNWNELGRSVASRGLKLPVRVAAPADVTVSAPGATVDSVTMAAGERVLLANQTTASQNGVYLWNGAAVAMTRATDSDTSTKLTDSLLVTVDEGTVNRDSIFTLSTNKPITVGSTALRFTRVHPSYDGASHPAGSAYQPANSKIENLPRDTVGLTAQTGLTTQIIRVFPLGVLRAGDTLAALNFQVSLAAVTVTNSWAGIARLSDRVILAISPTSAVAPAINTLKTFTFNTPYTADKDEVLVGFVMYQATTVPGFYGILHGDASIIAQVPIVNGTSNTGQTTPLTVGNVMTAYTAQPQMYYAFAT